MHRKPFFTALLGIGALLICSIFVLDRFSGRRVAMIAQNLQWRATGPAEPAPANPAPDRFVQVPGPTVQGQGADQGLHDPLGMALFDANNDGVLDLYLCRSGNPGAAANQLLLGAIVDGAPVYRSVADLAENTAYAKEELLMEDLFSPRSDANQALTRGRYSRTALAADFNADGRLDLLVGNAPHAADDVSDALPRRQYLTTARGEEALGANSLYINMGDADGDGVPEWRDVSRWADIEGYAATAGLAVADLDLDGDLDVFELNDARPRYDLWRTPHRAGGINSLHLNHLARYDNLAFDDLAADMDVDGRYDMGLTPPKALRLYRPAPLALLAPGYAWEPAAFKEVDGVISEPGAPGGDVVLQDVNGDGFLDIWTLDVPGYVRLYINQEGRRFQLTQAATEGIGGFWSAAGAADFDGDGAEDLLLGNIGGDILTRLYPLPTRDAMRRPTLADETLYSLFIKDGYSPHTTLISQGRIQRPIVLDGGLRSRSSKLEDHWEKTPICEVKPRFDAGSFHVFETVAALTTLDMDNDGRMDFYFAGKLKGAGAPGFAGPGRMIENRGEEAGGFAFADATQAAGVINLPPERLAAKRYAKTQWESDAGDETALSNLLTESDVAAAVCAADLNNDGYADLLVRNLSGEIRMFVNRGGDNHWLKVTLVDAESLNRQALGAVVTVNDRWMQVKRAGDGDSRANRNTALLFGLGTESARFIKVVWPGMDRAAVRYDLDDLRDVHLEISREQGLRIRE